MLLYHLISDLVFERKLRMCGVGALAVAGLAAGSFAQGPTTMPGSAAASAVSSNIELTLKCSASMVSGVENRVQLVIRNQGDAPIQYLNESALKSATFEVTESKHSVSHTALYAASTQPFSAWRLATLEKGSTATVDINFSRFFDLSIPGEYEISCKWVYLVDGKSHTAIGPKIKVIVSDSAKAATSWMPPPPPPPSQ